jgi:sarcosine oxidase subunit alpha
MKRLAQTPTQKIDHGSSLTFTWNGKSMTGLKGDSLASALYANQVRIFGRSLKYHRPRGLYSLDGESANTMVEVDGECNVRAETTYLKSGMKVKAQNFAGKVESDRWGFIDKFDGFMPAGFYYKRGHKPAAMWKPASKFIRKMAGTGVVDPNADMDTQGCAEIYLNAEVCVIGGGPAGMTAALAAAQGGARVVLFEARPWLGGFYDWRMSRYEGQPLYQRAAALAEKVEAEANIRVFKHAYVIDACGDNLVSAFQVGHEGDYFKERYISIRPNSVVVATGAIERPLIFEHNDRPGVMQAACALRLASQFGVLPGEKAVFSIGDDLGIEAALDLADLGLKVEAVADARGDGPDCALLEAMSDRNITYLPGWAASEVEGKNQVCGVTLGNLNGSGTSRFECDLLAASVGLSALTGPLNTAGAKMAYDTHTGFFLPQQYPPRMHGAGRMLGYADPAALEASGTLAGCMAASESGGDCDVKAAKETLASLPGPAKGCGLVHGPGIGKGAKAFVCLDEDGSFKTAKQSADQGMDMPELAKRFGGFGLGPGQSGVPGQNLPMVMAECRGEGPEGFTPTTVRSPLVPIKMSTLAGANHDIFKRTPMHVEQKDQSAVFRRIGVWKRARYFSADTSSAEEIKNVRENVGVIDVSTLGKFRLHGPDAEKVLQRVYISDMSKVPSGKTKYSAMLNDDGMLVDDGVVTKLGENDYYLTTSSGRAGATIEWMRYHTRFDGWDFNLINLTDHLAAINLAGPNSRKVLQKLVQEDIGPEAFPYMGYREFILGDKVPVRAMRVGFVGELGFELHFPASYGSLVWEWVMKAGQEFDIKPFGLEAQSCLRLEKGHVIIGQESEQRVNLLDLGMGFLWDQSDTASKKVGAPALKYTQGQTGRMKLIGFEMDIDKDRPLDGSVVYEEEKIEGFVCTCRKSQTLNKTIGIALVTDHLTEVGGSINIYQNDKNTPLRFTATVVKPHFYDPKGERQKI